ncbi:MAG: zinc ribbon domain-containing protein [Candidatus Hodarchaeales archaeon]|jgi:rRNA maturation endonuclease Nob1
MMKDKEKLKDLLIKVGSDLAKSDKEVYQWHDWFLRELEHYKNSIINDKVYATVLDRYKSFLEKKSDTSFTFIGEDLQSDQSIPDVKCSNCGSKNSASTHYCNNCGHPIEQREKAKLTDVSKTPERTEKSEERVLNSHNKETKEIQPKSGISEKDPIYDKTIKAEPIESSKRKSEKLVIRPVRKIQTGVKEKRVEPKGRSVRDYRLEWSDIVSFSRLTILGLGFFVLVLISIVFKIAGDRAAIGLIVLAFLFLLFGFVLDGLRWRNYSDWSALGAIIAYVGVILIFAPLLAYVFLETVDLPIIILGDGLGFILLFIGVGLRWNEYDTKLWDLGTMFWAYLRDYQYRKAFGALYGFGKNLLKGIFNGIKDGISNFIPRFKDFMRNIGKGLKIFFFSIFGLLSSIRRLSKTLWKNIHWIGLFAAFGYIILVGVSSTNNFINLELLIVMGFFFSLGVLFSQSERSSKVLITTRNFVLKGVISAYSMLSGTRIKTEEATFCSRCLRGVHKIEYEELRHVEQKQIPECPYCGHENWISVS